MHRDFRILTISQVPHTMILSPSILTSSILCISTLPDKTTPSGVFISITPIFHVSLSLDHPPHRQQFYSSMLLDIQFMDKVFANPLIILAFISGGYWILWGKQLVCGKGASHSNSMPRFLQALTDLSPHTLAFFFVNKKGRLSYLC